MKKYFLAAFTLSCFGLLTATGCSSAEPFTLTEKRTEIRPGTIAVICGSSDEKDIKLAEETTRFLKEKTGFRVMSQKEIEEKLPMYPSYLLEEQSIETDSWTISQNYLTEKNMAAISRIQQQLGVQYIFLIWAKGVDTSSCSGCCCMRFFGFIGGDYYRITIPVRIISFPEKEVIAYSNVYYSDYYSIFRFENSAVEKLLTSASESIVENFQKITSEKGK
jgi:hypothetical protein